ncbi:hypothetical protein Y032_0094g2736 [Ancylostoma ceylanicum]|uniref:Uncharacterized protein n=1 Tax=Ancylostoma ceylanicum TaxID=53326 RepID=A0A016TLE8_9BILA|nr:hypothetical protein Y032_0094g2736 [Ancylostoma ceylanicum]
MAPARTPSIPEHVSGRLKERISVPRTYFLSTYADEKRKEAHPYNDDRSPSFLSTQEVKIQLGQGGS